MVRFRSFIILNEILFLFPILRSANLGKKFKLRMKEEEEEAKKKKKKEEEGKKNYNTQNNV